MAAGDRSTSFGALLKRYRLAAGLSQESLAERARLSARAISSYERGLRQAPYQDSLRQLIHALKLSAEDELAFEAAVQRRRGPKVGSTPADTSSAHRSNLPAPHRLIGREQDSEAVRDLVLGAPGRLVTLTGTGGSGKSQLALMVAAGIVDSFPDGVYLVDLATVQAPQLVPFAVASVLGRRERTGETLLDTLVAYLRSRELLLVLDNCEHLIDVCASVVERILNACPQVRVLATSRERLRTGREVTWRVPSLATPDPGATLTPAELLTYPAVRLFVERAQAVESGFSLEPAMASSVVGICVRLEGLPLALELAAARVAALSPRQVLQRLDDTLRLLVGGSRTSPTRQQTLRGTLDWSHDLLTAAEQVVLRRLAIFAGGWSLEAAQTVCADSLVSPDDVLELLTHLVDKSLIVVCDEPDQRSCYRLLEPIRQYARDKLVESGDLDAVRERHALWFLSYADALERDASVGGVRRQKAVDALLGEYRNLQVALQWTLDTRQADVGLRLAWALQFVWKYHVPIGEGLLWSEAILALPGADAPTPARAVALLTAAQLAWLRGDHVAAGKYYSDAFPLVRQLADPWILFVALVDRGNEAQQRGDYAAARRDWEEGLTVTRASGDRASEAILLNQLASAEIAAGNRPSARARYAEALSLARQVKDPWVMTIVLMGFGLFEVAGGNVDQARALANECLSLKPDPPWRKSALLTLVQVALAEGDYAEARTQLVEALALAKDSGHRLHTVEVLDAVAEVVHAYRDNPRLGLRLAAVVEASWESVGLERDRLSTARHDRWLTSLRQTIHSEDATGWWAEGRALSVDEAIALAEEELKQTPMPPTHAAAAPLTPRQIEVAVQVAQGFTNRQIAAHLVITERAAAAHIEHILDRLGASSRAQIAVWASERGLLVTHAG